MNDVKSMTTDELALDLQYWFRVGRNEGGLQGGERQYFREVCNELARRRVLDRSEKRIAEL